MDTWPSNPYVRIGLGVPAVETSGVLTKLQQTVTVVFDVNLDGDSEEDFGRHEREDVP